MKEILTQTRGQALVEYGLILVLVAILVIIILSILGPAVGKVFSEVVTVLEGPQPGDDCYGSLLLPYLVGLTALVLLVFRLMPNWSYVMIKA